MTEKKRTTLEDRVMIVERAQAGQSSRAIAAELGWSMATVRKWRRRYRQQGRAGLSSRMGRPAAGPLATVPTELKKAILDLRNKHPGWGAQTLRLEIAKDEQFSGLKIPSRARIAAYLKEHKKVRRYERHQDLPQPQDSVVERPHQEWEMDAQGVTTVAGLGQVSFINLLDVHSHLSIDSHACLHTSHPRAETYQNVLRRAFGRYGLPEQISLDHDSAFFDNKSASPFPGTLHLWLMALGVQVRFIRKRPPLEHARIERHHQTLARQAFQGQTFDSVDALQRTLQARMLFLNREYPTRALDGQAPLQAFPHAAHSGRAYQLQNEEKLLDLERVYRYLQRGRWFRLVSSAGTFSLGGHIYYAAPRFAGQTLEITFDATTQQLVCQPEGNIPAFQLDIQDLTKEALMGKPAPLSGYIPYQPPLPLSYPDTTL